MIDSNSLFEKVNSQIAVQEFLEARGVEKSEQGYQIYNCGYHNGTEPSLRIADTGEFSCESCGAKGRGVVQIEMAISGLSRDGAVRKLGREWGIE